MTLSIIIPCYNEEDRLPSTLEYIQSFFNKESDFSLEEVIIVDDGSTDTTEHIAQSWAEKLPLLYKKFDQNKGKGAAVKAGMLMATSKYLLMYDADSATPIEELQKVPAALKAGADIVIGSRVAKENQDDVDMDSHRRVIGRIYYALTAPLIPGVNDAACGFKLFTKKAAQDVFVEQRLNRFAFDIEILSTAIRSGYTVQEIPVSWRSVPESKVSILRDGPEMFYRVLQLYLRK